MLTNSLPTVYWVPANNKSHPIKYTGNQEVKVASLLKSIYWSKWRCCCRAWLISPKPTPRHQFSPIITTTLICDELQCKHSQMHIFTAFIWIFLQIRKAKHNHTFIQSAIKVGFLRRNKVVNLFPELECRTCIEMALAAAQLQNQHNISNNTTMTYIENRHVPALDVCINRRIRVFHIECFDCRHKNVE